MNAPGDPTWQRTRALGTETWQLVRDDGHLLARVEAGRDGWWRSTSTSTGALSSRTHVTRDAAMLACELALKVLRGKPKPSND